MKNKCSDRPITKVNNNSTFRSLFFFARKNLKFNELMKDLKVSGTIFTVSIKEIVSVCILLRFWLYLLLEQLVAIIAVKTEAYLFENWRKLAAKYWIYMCFNYSIAILFSLYCLMHINLVYGSKKNHFSICNQTIILLKNIKVKC